jgi:hypothetical protein
MDVYLAAYRCKCKVQITVESHSICEICWVLPVHHVHPFRGSLGVQLIAVKVTLLRQILAGEQKT